MPPLPLDLERLIFEMAALQDTDHDSRVRIILVAKRVYEWIRPILYRIAIAEGRTTTGIRNWRNAQIPDVAPFTRHLLTLCGSITDAFKLASTFYNTENLAIWFGHDFGPKDFARMNDLPLRRLSVVISMDEAITFCPAFRNLTHLELIPLRRSTWDDCKALVEFPKLTHLCFAPPKVESQVGLLEHCPSLRALVYNVSRLSDADEWTIESYDPRFLVLLDHMLLEDFIDEWERSANGGIGLWELADMIIEARKDKLFKDNSSFIFSRRTWKDNLNDDGIRWNNMKGWRT